MMSHRSFIKTLVCFVALGASVAHAAPVTENVVFGNLGSTASDPFTTFATAQVGSTVSGSTGNSFAVPFVTGTNPEFLKFKSVVFALGDVAPENDALVKLVADSSGSPTGSVLASAQQTLGPNGQYTFGMGLVQLAASTTYWITLEAAGAASGNYFTWLGSNAAVAPSAQNSSGYSYPGNSKSNTDGAGWITNNVISNLSISVQAVPEPSTYALAAIGAGVAGLMSWRRRKVAADAAAAG
ncbi:MAG: hypothetical protein RLZZ21_216 [Planctomycetota bacterium]